jgi:uncharacterized protein (DUF305 family)
MNKKPLIYTIVGLAAGSLVTGLLLINRSVAEPQASRLNSPTNAQDNPQLSRQYPDNKKEFFTAEADDMHPMGMMTQQQADQHFIEMMIPHHQGAIDMANLALSKAKRPEIKRLAEAIKRDQNREIEQMKTWYKQWYGTEVPASSTMGMGRSRPSGMGMRGMGMMHSMGMNLDALKNATDFDKAFIEQMIPHHKMAVMMSAMVLDSNRPEMRNLAKSIIQTQSAEIELMRGWNQTQGGM